MFRPASVGYRYLSGLRAGGAVFGTGIDGRLSSPPSGVVDGAVSYTLDALCINWILFPVNPGLL